MKKVLALAAAAALVMSCSLLNVSAASQVFTDEATCGDSSTSINVYKYGPAEAWQCENNQDLGETFYSKHNTTAETYLIYKVNGSITNFRIKGFDCAGFGDMGRDIDCYLSEDENTWTKATVSATEQTPNDNYPANAAYWYDQVLTSSGTITGKNSFLKIILKQYPKIGPDSNTDNISWAIGIDKVTIQYTETTAETTTTTNKTTTTTSTTATTKTTTISTTTTIQGPVKGQIIDDADADYSKVFDRSENTQFESNAEINRTLFSKAKVPGSKPKDPDQDSFFTYYTPSNITGFSIEALICNGYGDVNRDITLYVSKDNSDGSWVQAAHKFTDPVAEKTYEGKPDDKVYWKTSTITPTNAIDTEKGYHYFKIVLKAVDKANGFPLWSVVLDKITIDYESTSETTTTNDTKDTTTTSQTNSTDTTTAPITTETTKSDTTASEATLSDTTTVITNTDSPKTGDDTSILFALLGIAGISAGSLALLKSKDN